MTSSVLLRKSKPTDASARIKTLVFIFSFYRSIILLTILSVTYGHNKTIHMTKKPSSYVSTTLYETTFFSNAFYASSKLKAILAFLAATFIFSISFFSVSFYANKLIIKSSLSFLITLTSFTLFKVWIVMLIAKFSFLVCVTIFI